MTHADGKTSEPAWRRRRGSGWVGAGFLLLGAFAAIATSLAGFPWVTSLSILILTVLLAAWIVIAAIAPTAARVFTLLVLVLLPLGGLIADRLLSARVRSGIHQQLHHLAEVGGAVHSRQTAHAP